ncbi:MAG TPA: triose-phosphate isomerase, partial [Phycisphaerae bacterium]|nr:triose-phosphate isomerase [Phycisphaerae bacterium]
MSSQNRRQYIAGNWKMNLSLAEAKELAGALGNEIGQNEQVDVAVCPASVYITEIAKVLSGTKIAVGAQNMYFEDNGAYTGEISGAMVKDAGCSCVILGHSERRHVLGESDELINKKVLKALSDGIEVILCVGELLSERQANETLEVVTRQIKTGLEGVDLVAAGNVTIAYEPVWAIGTGETATPAQAQEVHKSIRDLLAKIY